MVRELRFDDFEDIAKWFEGRGKKLGPVDLYPNTGFIEPGVCAGFLYMTNSNLALIENMISNPRATLRSRYLATNEISDKLIKLAYDTGHRYLSMTTNTRSIARLAARRGFKEAETTHRYVLTIG